MPQQLSSPGIGLLFKMLPMGDRRARTPCMRKENVKIFLSVQCTGKKVLAGNQPFASGCPLLQKLLLCNCPAQFLPENDIKLENVEL